MIRRFFPISLLSLGIGCLGCNQPTTEYKAVKQLKADHHTHEHSTHEGAHHHYGAGPHGGSVFELGGDDYHAELVFDHDAHLIRLFLLKADVKSPLPTKTAEATLNVDQGKPVTLKAAPLDGETDGVVSRFEREDEELVHTVLDKGYLHGDLVVEINGKKFESHLDLHFDNTAHDHKASEAKKGSGDSKQ